MSIIDQQKQFPEGMKPLGNKPFRFSCHSGISCFLNCCRNVDMILYPYDIIRLKAALKIDSEQFMRKHTRLIKGDNPYFPTVMLQLMDDEAKSCPFLDSNGCSVYQDRPSACRTYPLERAVDRKPERGRPKEFYFLTNHSYCKGHLEDKEYIVKEWLRDQRISDYNSMNDIFAELDTVFRDNPWQGEGSGGPKQQLAFMVCYDIDRFRAFAASNKLLSQFRLPKDQKRRINVDDGELLKFGFEWLKLILIGRSSLIANPTSRKTF